MKVKSTINNNKLYSKASKSMERIKPSNKLNLSIMDEKLSILNSDIEELYKKYVEKKKLRQIKEKNEQTLSSRINFLIDEERKIKNQIENKIIKNPRCSKNRSVKYLRAPEINMNSSSIRYNTIESNDESPRPIKNRLNNSRYRNRKAKYINNSNKNESEGESDMKNKQYGGIIKKNGMNDITLSSIQNNSSIENNNITIGNRSNITNNVCIIINNSEKNNSKIESNNKNISFQDISFAEKENNFFDINSTDKRTYEKETNKSNTYFNIQENEKENKINDEINYIKMRLASKLEENIKLVSQTYQNNSEISLGQNNINNNNSYINEMSEKKTNYINNFEENFENNLKTPSFKQNKTLNEKIKELKALVFNSKDDNEKQSQKYNVKIKERKQSLENKKNIKRDISMNSKNKKIHKRCFSKPDNGINKQKKVYRKDNQNTIKKISNRSQIIKKIINIKKAINNQENGNTEKIDNNYENLSIDSDEIILSDSKINKSKQKLPIKKNNNKPFKSKINKNFVNRHQPKEENIYYEYDSTPNILKNINLTFNQSIEKKRQLLGIQSNIKENLNKKLEDISKNYNKNVKKEINAKKDKKNRGGLYDKNNENKKSSRTLYDKKNNNKKINNKQKNKKVMHLNQLCSPYKEERYDNESYQTATSNNNIGYIQIFKNSNYKKNIFENREKNNKHIASTSSLTSLYSTQTNKSNKTQNYTLFQNKNNNYDYSTHSNYNIFRILKLKKNKENKSNNNNNIIIKKNENKNYLNSIRLIKKREKNNKKENKNINNEEKIENNNREENLKYYENEIKPRKELAVIRRINKRIENYKKNGPQVYQISKRHKNRFEINNFLNNNRKNNGQSHSFRRLSEIQRKSNISFSHKNIGVTKSKSNRSLPKPNKICKSFNF